MRRLGTALLSFAIGIAFGVPGLCLLIFLCLLMWQPELAPEWSGWVEAHSALSPDNFPRQLLNELSQGKSPWAAWGAAAFLSFVGYSALRGARDSLRPADQSSGGEAQVVIKTQYPCVGSVLEGDLKLLETPEPEQVFRVTLLCRYIDRSLSKKRESSIFVQSQDVKIVRVAEGWHLPFHFEVPADAPPSTVRNDLDEALAGLPTDEYSWFIEFCRADAWIAVPSKFPITLSAAPVDTPAGPESAAVQLLMQGDPQTVEKIVVATRTSFWRILKMLLIAVIVIPLAIAFLLFAANFLLFGK